MAVDSIKRIPTLQVHQGTDTKDQREKQRQDKKEKKNSLSSTPQDNKAEETSSSGLGPDGGQILDSARTIELLQIKPVEPSTLKKHAFVKMAHLNNVKNPTEKNPNKLNKSA